MMKPAWKHVMFDLDGTLTESGEGIMNGCRYALRHFGITDPAPEKLRKMIGPPLNVSIPEYFGLSEEDTAEAVRLFRDYYKKKGAFENRPYAGIPALLEDLNRAGISCYIVTTKPQPQAEVIADHFGLAPFLKCIAGTPAEGQKESGKAPLIRKVLETFGIADRREAVMVGDRFYDIEGAAQTGISSVGVLYGYGAEEELRHAGAEEIAESVEELWRILLG